MRRAILGSLALLFFFAASAWAQEAAPGPEQPGGSLSAWLVLLLPMAFAVLFVLFVFRRQKTNMAAVDRSLKMSEERIQLARQQVALQEETNRLLKQLIAGKGHADPE